MYPQLEGGFVTMRTILPILGFGAKNAHSKLGQKWRPGLLLAEIGYSGHFFEIWTSIFFAYHSL